MARAKMSFVLAAAAAVALCRSAAFVAAPKEVGFRLQTILMAAVPEYAGLRVKLGNR